jgi:hypothetical protein
MAPILVVYLRRGFVEIGFRQSVTGEIHDFTHQGLPRLVDAARMHGGEIAEAAEVRHIQCENVAHRVDVHGRCQPSIVHLNAQHTVL